MSKPTLFQLGFDPLNALDDEPQHGSNLWGKMPARTLTHNLAKAAALAGPMASPMSTPFNDPLQDEDERLACAVKCMPTVAATEAWAVLTNEERVQKCYEMADEFYKQRNIYKR
jgi:hypothetical protein